MDVLHRSLGVHRVLEPAGVLPQAALRLDADPRIGPDEVCIAVHRLNLDAASYRQLAEEHGGDGDRVRAAVLGIVERRGKMHNPVTGSGGMLIGVVDEVGDDSPLGLEPGQRVATLVSLTLTPLRITDGLAQWDGRSEQVPAAGTAVLFARSIAAVLPDDLPQEVALAVLDVCGAPATTERVVHRSGHRPSVAVLGAAGKSGCLSLAAARDARAGRLVGVVRDEGEATALRAARLADEVVVADATDPLAVATAVGQPVDVTVVCVDTPGAEHGAVLATADGGTVVFFSMATSFSAAALGAEGMAADVTMLVGNGYTPGHAALAMDLYRHSPGVRSLIEPRVRA
ncbi:L-erythro-3,5-diaminohexanoate dehydrogenase [Modestobacter sp. VKM Ac-2984]|uniref:L-erythro-3,5-diaminohexanoate dehydrogenase n=1 Tax=Modestobacter sp. VKM Ac-2984 TaxID=3004138 RepID=UPI0022AA92E2|nr:L-erythro-3,5-diaminohexanoate dehydrogenase [Modestobacter sp. VKM Ac-2984]MCZ2816249.1 L-erythro-3,5-diaminohexanoate dehydrogenase [Modestobacter sp. VKM Ac-2984]